MQEEANLPSEKLKRRRRSKFKEESIDFLKLPPSSEAKISYLELKLPYGMTLRISVDVAG